MKENKRRDFIEQYNLMFNSPNTKASVAICEEYKKEHQSDFKVSDWSIEKHRKKLMDWMSARK